MIASGSVSPAASVTWVSAVLIPVTLSVFLLVVAIDLIHSLIVFTVIFDIFPLSSFTLTFPAATGMVDVSQRLARFCEELED